ncbi:MAG: quinone-dependent dihydroorotate dehydrogenase [Flavobacteriaceae bacterium]|nr:quinone-dependent dihydroorotate dehydrogenase [Flavobacteriaceae bacterium]
MYKLFIRPIFFIFDPEKIHHITFRFIRFISRFPFMGALLRKLYKSGDKRLEREVFGITFPNPVGLAAGFDKDAKLYRELSNFGFGFVEIGTVTPRAQKGNPKKRLFRLKADEGIINRMGFNNEGVLEAVERLKKNEKVIIGGNIGKNTATAPENYTQDYIDCFEALHPYVDYFVVNVSCPNVGSHAKLQDKDYLLELLKELQTLNQAHNHPKPITLKIAPDLNEQQLDEIIEVVKVSKIDGVIASNTSVNREGLKTSDKKLETIGYPGGLSGKPITNRSTRVIKYLSEKSNHAFPIIGVGGIHSADDALDKIEAGASLIQLYTGFIYEGPSLIKKINKAIITNQY